MSDLRQLVRSVTQDRGLLWLLRRETADPAHFMAFTHDARVIYRTHEQVTALDKDAEADVYSASGNDNAVLRTPSANAAISSRASNIGFAVPINQAVANLEQLKASGRVSRGFIGVYLTDVTPAFQQTLGLPVSHGALVQDLTLRSPGDRAGLRPYDVIIEVDGRPVTTNEELIHEISARQPGTVARLEVIRDGRRFTMPIKLAERPRRGEEVEAPDPLPDRGRGRAQEPRLQPALGVSVREMDRGFMGRLDIPESVRGVVVSRVDPTGAAFGVLRRGCVIMEINRRSIRSVAPRTSVPAFKEKTARNSISDCSRKPTSAFARPAFACCRD